MKKVLSLENLIYLTIFFLPIYLIRFSIFGFSTNVLDWLLFACLVVGAIFHRDKIITKLLLRKEISAVFLVGLIFSGFVVSVLVNRNYATGLGIIKSWFLLPIAFAFLSKAVIREDRLKNIFFVYYFSAFFVALISLTYFFCGAVTFDGRLQGFFNSPNYLAMYLAPAIFVLYQLLFWAQSLKRKLGVLFCGVAILSALFLTQSYASWLAIFVAFSFVFLLEQKIYWRKLLVIALILVAIIFSQLGEDKFSKLVNLENRSSLSSRKMIWRSTEKILKDNWLWGIGAGNFQTKYLAEQKNFPPYLEWAVPHPHNLYLAFWLYGGIGSLLSFLLLLCFWFYRVLRIQKKSQLKFIVLGIMVYVLLHGVVDTTYFKNDLAVIFWLLFVLL